VSGGDDVDEEHVDRCSKGVSRCQGGLDLGEGSVNSDPDWSPEKVGGGGA
jgi:hypothetical protein